MSLKMKLMLVVCGGLVAFAAAALTRGWYSGQSEQAPVAPMKDFSNHPIYSKYDFGARESVIDFGIQPLGVPIGVISETMGRDMVLTKALRKQGLEMRFHPFLKGADLNFFLQRGDLEVALGGDMPALAAAAAFNVLITSLAKQGFSSIVTKEHILIRELRGKRIGYPYGSNAHYALLQALSTAGLKETDVRSIPLDVNEMPDALAQGKIEAFVGWEPFISIALARFDDFVVIHRSLSTSYLYFSGSFAKKYPGAARQIVASQIRSMAWMRSHDKNLFDACKWTLQAGKEFSGKETVLSAEQYASLVKSDLLDIVPVPFIPERDLVPEGRLYREFEFLKGLGKIPETAEWSKVRSSFDRKIMDEVLSAGKKYQLDTFEYSDEERK